MDAHKQHAVSNNKGGQWFYCMLLLACFGSASAEFLLQANRCALASK